MNLVLDTNAYSHWRRFGLWEPLLTEAEHVWMPSIVLGELRAGFLRGRFAVDNESKLADFLSSPVVQVASVDESTSHLYGSFKQHLRNEGTPIPDNDIWIAAICFEKSATLLTAERHFGHLPQVSVLWPEG